MAKVTIEEAESLRVGPDFEIASVDPASTPGLSDGNVDGAYSDFDEEIAELQECLYANGRAGNEKGHLRIPGRTRRIRRVCAARRTAALAAPNPS